MIRDQFLTEKIGYTHQPYAIMRVIDFSTWEDFGLLWEWAKEQEWWNTFMRLNSENMAGPIELHINTIKQLINPNFFADEVAKYLGWKED